MTKIIYGHSGDSLHNLKIAGDFSNWEALPMVKNPKSGLWEFSVNVNKLPKDATKVHFKFIDDSGTWFTNEDYEKEIDEHSNENNVEILKREEEAEAGREESDTNDDDKEQSYVVDDEGPLTPIPSLKGGATDKSDLKLDEEVEQMFNKSPKRDVAEQDDEPVGGSAVLVSHSDAEDTANTTTEQERPNTSGTVYSSRGNDPEQYKNILARIIAFFTNLFHSWFS